jgi:hypothetical protein
MKKEKQVLKLESYHICDYCNEISYQTCDYCGKDYCENCEPDDCDDYYFRKYNIVDTDKHHICKYCMDLFIKKYRDDATTQIKIANDAKMEWKKLLLKFINECKKADV